LSNRQKQGKSSFGKIFCVSTQFREAKELRRLSAALIRLILLGATLFGPIIVGIVTVDRVSSKMALVLGSALGLLLGSLWYVSGYGSELTRKVTYVVVSCFLTLTLADVVVRPFVSSSLSATFNWPPMPLVRRNLPNLRGTRTIYGESAQASNMAKYREYRVMRYGLDPFGFRNDHIPDGPLDVIVLGDSFAAGTDTTQDQTWSGHPRETVRTARLQYGDWRRRALGRVGEPDNRSRPIKHKAAAHRGPLDALYRK
jgi:hypothetical protein